MSVASLTGWAAASWRTHAGRWLLAGAAGALAACLLKPGWPVERARFLGLELVEGALDGAKGLIVASGRALEPAKKVA